MSMYTMFPHFGCKELFDKIIKRLHELGYEGKGYFNPELFSSVSILSSREKPRIMHTGFIVADDLENHELGNTVALFNTKVYECKKSLQVGGHKVHFTDDGMEVGCTKLTHEEIEKVYRAYVNQKL